MKKAYIAVIALFLGLLTLCGVLVFAVPARSFSENENRKLAEFPEFHQNEVVSGKWQENLNDFLTDQFPLRDTLTAVSSALTRLVGIRDMNGAYIGKDGYYFELVTERGFPRDRYQNNLRHLEAFAMAHPDLPVTVLLAPSAGIILPDKLPTFAELYDADRSYLEAKNMLASCTVLDVRDTLTSAVRDGAQIYYRTDHHWTTYGAYLAYTDYCASKGVLPKTYAEFAPHTASDEFLGTLYSKVLDASALPDTVEIPTVPDTLTVTADGEEISMFSSDVLEGKDKYLVFFGGNYGEVVIRNEAATNGKTLLVVKDSYANSFVPFLAETYQTVIMIDPRYFGGNVTDVIAAENVTDVLFLFEMSGFAHSDKLYKIH